MRYHQLTSGERYMLSALRKQGFSQAAIARALHRHPSTISRELRRNCLKSGWYRPSKAIQQANGRRVRTRRHWQFTSENFDRVVALLEEKWSPEQISGWLSDQKELHISHETIYRYIWEDKRSGGALYRHLRTATKQRRKRQNTYDSRGRLAGKRHISERPLGAEHRSRFGHWEIDTVMGRGPHCIVTLVERSTGFVAIGKLKDRTMGVTARRTINLIKTLGLPFRSITSDNGTEFHSYKSVEAATGTKYFFANPYHSWERGTNENTNGLIRQYLPKGQSMAHLTQRRCNEIAEKLNNRPRKRYGYRTPEEMVYGD